MKTYRIGDRTSGPYSIRQNIADTIIVKVKVKWSRRMVRRQVTERLLDYGLVYGAQIISRTAGKDSRTPLEKVTWDTPYILEWV